MDAGVALAGGLTDDLGTAVVVVCLGSTADGLGTVVVAVVPEGLADEGVAADVVGSSSCSR